MQQPPYNQARRVFWIMDNGSAHRRCSALPDYERNILAWFKSKPWCFIASAVFGEAAAETDVLRALRDSVLRRYALGRAFMRLYYRLSPALAIYLAARPRAQGFMRHALKPAVAIVRWLLERRR